jgi:hypothetical protein
MRYTPCISEEEESDDDDDDSDEEESEDEEDSEENSEDADSQFGTDKGKVEPKMFNILCKSIFLFQQREKNLAKLERKKFGEISKKKITNFKIFEKSPGFRLAKI